jgi:hypothetical protein
MFGFSAMALHIGSSKAIAVKIAFIVGSFANSNATNKAFFGSRLRSHLGRQHLNRTIKDFTS